MQGLDNAAFLPERMDLSVLSFDWWCGCVAAFAGTSFSVTMMSLLCDSWYGGKVSWDVFSELPSH